MTEPKPITAYMTDETRLNWLCDCGILLGYVRHEPTQLVLYTNNMGVEIYGYAKVTCYVCGAEKEWNAEGEKKPTIN